MDSEMDSNVDSVVDSGWILECVLVLLILTWILNEF